MLVSFANLSLDYSLVYLFSVLYVMFKFLDSENFQRHIHTFLAIFISRMLQYPVSLSLPTLSFIIFHCPYWYKNKSKI
jgi:hypothetical protein